MWIRHIKILKTHQDIPINRLGNMEARTSFRVVWMDDRTCESLVHSSVIDGWIIQEILV